MDMTDEELEAKLMKEAAPIEEAIRAACGGAKAGVAYLAIGRVLGEFMAQEGQHPRIETMRMVGEIAGQRYLEKRREARNG